MKTITVSIPQNLYDITLSQFQRISMLSGEEDIDVKTMAYLSIIYGMTWDQVNSTPVKHRDHLVKCVDEILSSSPSFVNRFSLHGVEYGFIPDLDRLTAGELVDIETEGFLPENLHKLCSILYRPITEKIGEKYLIESYMAIDRSDIMKDSPAGIIVGALLFFYRITMDCSIAIPKLKGMIRRFTKLGEDLERNGDGIQR